MLASTLTISRSPTGALTGAASGAETGGAGAVLCHARVHARDAAVLQQREPEPRAARCARERLAAQLLIASDIAVPRRVGSSIALLSRAITHARAPARSSGGGPGPRTAPRSTRQVRRAQPGIGREPFAREHEHLVGQLVRAPRPRACRHQPRPARPCPARRPLHRTTGARTRTPARSARPCRHRPARGGPSRTSPAPDPAGQGTPRPANRSIADRFRPRVQAPLRPQRLNLRILTLTAITNLLQIVSGILCRCHRTERHRFR